VKIYSQRDPQWKNETLGTKGTIGSVGCTVSCIGNLADLTPSEVNQRLKSVNGFANGNLVIWSKIEEAIPWLQFVWRGYEYNNYKVTKAIEENGGCLVEVSGARIGGSKHWLLFIGNRRAYDPWTGEEISTSLYTPITGYAEIKVIGQPESPIMQSNLLEHIGVKDENEAIAVWDKEMAFLKDARTKNEGLKEEIERIKAENAESYAQAELRKKELSKFKEDLAKKLFLPASSDQTDIISSVERLLTVEDQLTKANKTISQEQKKYEVEKSEMQKEIDVLKTEIEAERQKRDETEKKLLERIESLENRLNETESSSDATNQWKAFIDKLLSIFNRR